MKTLLLNASYEILSLINLRKTIKLFLADKVEIISEWDEYLIEGKMKYPSIARLKYYVRWVPRFANCTRRNLFIRDEGTCQYCSKKLTWKNYTIDHVIPKDQGGGWNWKNLVVSCSTCNNNKGNRTPEEARMTLLKEPKPLNRYVYSNLFDGVDLHEDWKIYIK